MVTASVEDPQGARIPEFGIPALRFAVGVNTGGDAPQGQIEWSSTSGNFLQLWRFF